MPVSECLQACICNCAGECTYTKGEEEREGEGGRGGEEVKLYWCENMHMEIVLLTFFHRCLKKTTDIKST